MKLTLSLLALAFAVLGEAADRLPVRGRQLRARNLKKRKSKGDDFVGFWEGVDPRVFGTLAQRS